jgi:hypothetical protein
MIVQRSVYVCLLSWCFAGIAAAQPQFYTPQPFLKHSTMFGLNWEVITDNDFADMAEGLLMNGGNSNARSAMFLFEQCFSGGMFGELEDAFDNDVPWVGGSAARHDELSWGEGDSDPFPMDFWANSLQLAMQQNDTMIETVNLARILDQAGPSYSNKEHPQSIYRNGGENINHRSLGASSHNAILWAGNADGERHVNDITVLYNKIRADFMDTGEAFHIIVLGDSGDLGIPAQPATKANLQAAFDAMEAFQGPNADFMFFASDHGGTDTYFQLEEFVIAAATSYRSSFALSPLELEGMLRSDDTPELVLSFHGLLRPGVQLFFDAGDGDIDLGDAYDWFDPESLMAEIPIDPETLSFLARDGDPILLRIDNDSDSDVTLAQGLFRTSGITNFLVPEPATLVLLACGMLPIFSCRRRP